MVVMTIGMVGIVPLICWLIKVRDRAPARIKAVPVGPTDCMGRRWRSQEATNARNGGRSQQDIPREGHSSLLYLSHITISAPKGSGGKNVSSRGNQRTFFAVTSSADLEDAIVRILGAIGVACLLLAACSSPQQALGTTAGAVGGAVVGGPVGAVVGGAGGAVVTAPGAPLGGNY
jgi:hypothetical protein